jgi:hypothetical protein
MYIPYLLQKYANISTYGIFREPSQKKTGAYSAA